MNILLAVMLNRFHALCKSATGAGTFDWNITFFDILNYNYSSECVWEGMLYVWIPRWFWMRSMPWASILYSGPFLQLRLLGTCPSCLARVGEKKKEWKHQGSHSVSGPQPSDILPSTGGPEYWYNAAGSALQIPDHVVFSWYEVDDKTRS